ncbi:MAG: hypothetical protein ACTHMS_07790 [Jatrophihabitans sp.]|uniref:hypothetical protein n=1 Tax=Jatrophihabitans sp. TaxID=1932789 RepID=UPI003F7D8577
MHAGLIGTAVLSLVLEPDLALHIGLGLAFVWLVVVHLAQRRRTGRRLLRSLAPPRPFASPSSRLATSDAILTLLTAGMLVSGLWDWLDGRTRIRRHALTGVILAAYLVVHSWRRRRRLRRSVVT